MENVTRRLDLVRVLDVGVGSFEHELARLGRVPEER